jgi:hypothetical protein
VPAETPYSLPKPNSQRYFGGVTKQSKAVTEFLNSATGGDKVIPGALDFSPALLDYYAGYFTGGLGKSVGQATNSIATLAEGSIPKASEIPAFSRFMGEKSDWTDYSNYTQNLRPAILLAEKRVEMATEARNTQLVGEIRKESRAQLSMVEQIKATDKQLNALRRLENDVKLNNQLTDEQKASKLEDLRGKRQLAMTRVLKTANDKNLLP